jgi:hypothetical protein
MSGTLPPTGATVEDLIALVLASDNPSELLNEWAPFNRLAAAVRMVRAYPVVKAHIERVAL